MSSLLPPNSTELERKVATANAKGTDLDVQHKTLSTIDDAPNQFLSVLGWQNSVDRWNRDWTDAQKKAQIKASFKIHQKKGTVAALKAITKAFGYSLSVTEWWQENPVNTPGTFQITIDTEGKDINEQAYNTLIDLLLDAKPLTRELTSIEINVITIRGDTHVACAMYDGEDVTIYPQLHQPIPSIFPGLVHFGDDVTEVRPLIFSAIPNLFFQSLHLSHEETIIYPRS